MIDEWTAISDIGRQFAAGVLTEQEYVSTEQAYVDVALSFQQDAGCPVIYAIGVEDYGFIPHALAGSLCKAPREGQLLDRGSLAAAVRSCLREDFWCKLESPDARCQIHFGYDYYVYLIGVEVSETTRTVARDGHLHIEEY